VATKKTSNNALATITVIPAGLQNEAGRIFTKNEFDELPFVQDMKPKEKEQLWEDIKGFQAARIAHVQGGLAMGHFIKSIYDRCENYSGAFRRLLTGFRFSERTAYRYMATFNNVSEKFSNPYILKAAIVRGLPILSYDEKRPLGKYTEAVRLLPPPRAISDEKEANRYLDQLEQTQKERQRKIAEGRVKPRESETTEEIQRDPEFLLKVSYRGIKNALRQMPARKRQPWLDRLFGYVLAHQGISNPMTIEPQAVPEEFNQGPGRPTGATIPEEEVA
jgi:hypothetical protein